MAADRASTISSVGMTTRTIFIDEPVSGITPIDTAVAYQLIPTTRIPSRMLRRNTKARTSPTSPDSMMIERR